MNFDIWRNELTIYEKESISVDEGEIMTLFDSGKGITLHLKEGYKLSQDDDGHGNKIYVIKKGE